MTAPFSSDIGRSVDLETLADWYEHLRTQVRRAELLFELGLLDDEHIEALKRRALIWGEAVECRIGYAKGMHKAQASNA